MPTWTTSWPSCWATSDGGSWLAELLAEDPGWLRAGMIDPSVRDRRSRKWKRWERGAPMELWQTDIVGGFPLADRTSAKALTGIDDHSRMCVCARLMVAEHPRGLRRVTRRASAL